MSTITLTTDFGYRDPFVGVMKGVIAGIAPEARVIDLTHGIAPQDISEASLALLNSYKYFPLGTVHVAVVDPGVGSLRRPIIMEADNYLFVGPDNGIFSGVAEEAGWDCVSVHHITDTSVFLHSPGCTFHGRDVFAPVAAWLLKGRAPETFGPAVEDMVRLPRPVAEEGAGEIVGEVVHIDAFGNAMTNISGAMVKAFMKRAGITHISASVRGASAEFVGYYAEGVARGLCVLVDSAGYLELFVYMSEASKRFGITRGDEVVVRAAG